MAEQSFYDQTFDSDSFTGKPVNDLSFEKCIFTHAGFSYAEFTNTVFENCTFINCDLSLAKLKNAGMNSVTFRDCKLMGVDFGKCKDFLFSVQFERCILDYAVFHKRKMKKTSFTGCSLIEADCSEADLSHSVFDNCNLLNTVFNDTQLTSADFRAAYNYVIDPELNRIKHAKFAMHGLAGLLQKYQLTIE